MKVKDFLPLFAVVDIFLELLDVLSASLPFLSGNGTSRTDFTMWTVGHAGLLFGTVLVVVLVRTVTRLKMHIIMTRVSKKRLDFFPFYCFFSLEIKLHVRRTSFGTLFSLVNNVRHFSLVCYLSSETVVL